MVVEKWQNHKLKENKLALLRGPYGRAKAKN